MRLKLVVSERKIKMDNLQRKSIQLDCSQKNLNQPLELQHLEVLEKRGGLDTETKKALWIHRTGFQGEQNFYEFIFRLSKPHWKVLYRTWLNINGRVECDFIVITRVGIYCFEIKNYNGNLVYENNQQTLNHRIINGDLIGQFKNMQAKTNEMSRQMNYSGGVFQQLVYINPYYQATVPQEWGKNLLHFNQLTDYLNKMLVDETVLSPANYSPEEVVAYIDQAFVCEEPYPLSALPPEKLKQLKHGIDCTHCGSFNTISTRYKIICLQCNESEPRERAALRLIGDYSVLVPFIPLRAVAIAKIGGDSFQREYIRKILKRYYQLAQVERTGLYLNPSQNFDHTYPHLCFKLKNASPLS